MTRRQGSGQKKGAQSGRHAKAKAKAKLQLKLKAKSEATNLCLRPGKKLARSSGGATNSRPLLLPALIFQPNVVTSAAKRLAASRAEGHPLRPI